MPRQNTMSIPKPFCVFQINPELLGVKEQCQKLYNVHCKPLRAFPTPFSVSNGGARNYSMSAPKLLCVFQTTRTLFWVVSRIGIFDMVVVASRDVLHHMQLRHAFPGRPIARLNDLVVVFLKIF